MDFWLLGYYPACSLSGLVNLILSQEMDQQIDSWLIFIGLTIFMGGVKRSSNFIWHGTKRMVWETTSYLLGNQVFYLHKTKMCSPGLTPSSCRKIDVNIMKVAKLRSAHIDLYKIIILFCCSRKVWQSFWATRWPSFIKTIISFFVETSSWTENCNWTKTTESSLAHWRV